MALVSSFVIKDIFKWQDLLFLKSLFFMDLVPFIRDLMLSGLFMPLQTITNVQHVHKKSMKRDTNREASLCHCHREASLLVSMKRDTNREASL